MPPWPDSAQTGGDPESRPCPFLLHRRRPEPRGGDALDAKARSLGMGGELAPEVDPEGYRRRMRRRQEVQRQRVGERNLEKGLVLVFTGDGKGKTTAALGLVLRTLGHGERVAVVQFIKGGWDPGEARALARFGDDLHWHALGEGFTWETQDRARDRQMVQKAWECSLAYLQMAERKLVVLDEVNVALKLGYLSVEQVLEGLTKRPPPHPRRPDGPRGTEGAAGAGRSGHRDDPGAPSLPGAGRSGPGRDRILIRPRAGIRSV